MTDTITSQNIDLFSWETLYNWMKSLMKKVCILLVLITYGNGGKAPLISNLSMRRCQQSSACPSHFNPAEKKKRPQNIVDSRTGVPQSQSGCFEQETDLLSLLRIEPWFLWYPAITPVIILMTELWLILCAIMLIWIFLHRWYFSKNKW